jgi:hypothetical protein
MNDAAQKPHPPWRGAATYDEMIEKAARAIYESDLGNSHDAFPLWSQCAAFEQSAYRDNARAAFAAIGLTPECVIVPKEPTEEMVAEGAEASWEEDAGIRYIYRAMLVARPAGDGLTEIEATTKEMGV